MYLCPKNIMRLFYRIASHEKGPECCKKSMNLSQSTFTRPTLLVAPVTAQTFDSFEMRPSKAKLSLGQQFCPATIQLQSLSSFISSDFWVSRPAFQFRNSPRKFLTVYNEGYDRKWRPGWQLHRLLWRVLCNSLLIQIRNQEKEIGESSLTGTIIRLLLFLFWLPRSPLMKLS